ncbi:hypothetical protein BDA96_10G004000 [Sorghum bicolor]|uniref:Uncharacterized protein n=1 Tax=Sorghum bicolor TaxID=4558 RepID=A0A921Q0T1_SORBI|nr:hypothetical protein BDA96_10G004000 [Sorghum bicolor]
MKRASEVKRLVRCSEESVAGDGSMCAAVGVNKCSPKLLAADGTMRGVGITKKRPRKADKPSKKEERRRRRRRAEDKIAPKLEKQAASDGFILKKEEKRTKKRKGDEVMGNTTMADDNTACGMTKLSQELLDYLRTKEVMGFLATEAPLPLWANKMAGALFDFDQRLKEEIATEFQENREFDAHIIKETETATEEEENKRRPNNQQPNQVQEEGEEQVMTETELAEKSKKKKLLDCTIHEIEMSCDPSTEDRRLANRRRHIENQANLLRQYRINMDTRYAVLQYEVTDDQRDAEV